MKEYDDETMCHVSPEGPGTRCYELATRSVFEPYTPASFEVRCCEEHAESHIQFGYLRKRPAKLLQCADCLAWIKEDQDHTCRQMIARNRRSA